MLDENDRPFPWLTAIACVAVEGAFGLIGLLVWR